MNTTNIHKSAYVILIYFIMNQFVGIIGVQLLAKTGWYDIHENQEQAIQQILVHWELIGFLLILIITFTIYKENIFINLYYQLNYQKPHVDGF